MKARKKTGKVQGSIDTGYILPNGCVTKAIRKGSIEHKLVSHNCAHTSRGEAAPNPWAVQASYAPLPAVQSKPDSPKLVKAIRAEIARRSKAKKFPITVEEIRADLIKKGIR